MLKNTPIATSYLLKTQDNGFIGGCVKEEYLVDSAISFSIKQGSSGLNKVIVIGYDESHEPDFDIPKTTLLGFGTAINQIYKNLIFPQDFRSITPIFIFRHF